MTWIKTFPTEPGRYWWRAPNKHPKVQLPPSYGLLLISWTEPSLVRHGIEPELRVRAQVTFDGHIEGESKGYGWSTGGGHSSGDFLKHYPGVEFWDAPELGPEAFLPALPKKPDWTPPDPVVIAAEYAASARKRAAEDAAERKAFNYRVADAVRRGAVLYRCEKCQEIYDHDALVQVRECPHCDEKFNGTENGQACPACNRKFSRNITELGCPDCLDEEDCEPLAETPEPVKPARKKKR